MTRIDLEARLTEALAARAEQVPPSFPHRVAPQRPRRRGRRVAVGLTAACLAAAVAVVSTIVHTGFRAESPTATPVAFTIPGTAIPMKPGQFMYRKVSAVDPNNKFTVVELWEPQVRSDVWTVKISYLNADGTEVRPADTTTGKCGIFLRLANPADEAELCSEQGSWTKPTTEFVNKAPQDAATIYAQLHQAVLDYLPTVPEKPVVTTDENVAFLTINFLASLGEDTGGLSQPFSKALADSAAMIPGVIVKQNVKNLLGFSGTGYEIDAGNGNIAGPVIFDANGNYIGRTTTAVSVGVADVAGAPPVTVTY